MAAALLDLPRAMVEATHQRLAATAAAAGLRTAGADHRIAAVDLLTADMGGNNMRGKAEPDSWPAQCGK